MKGKYDILWKGMLERVFDDFLRFVFPDADQRFDMEKGFTYLDKELAMMNPNPEEGADTRFVDKLVQVYTLDGKEKFLLVHVEVQGSYDKTFTGRMFKYFYRVYDYYNQRPVLPVAVFSGEGGKWMGNRFHLEGDGMSLTYTFKTLDIADYTEEELKASDNSFAGVMLVAKGLAVSAKERNKKVQNKNWDKIEWDEKLLEQKVLLVEHLHAKGFEESKIDGILSFIENYVLFENPENNRNFKERIDKITNKPNKMDILEQVAEIREAKARKEEREKSVRAFLSNIEFSSEKIAELVGVSVSFVEQIKLEVRPK
jgi:hypothetical protein